MTQIITHRGIDPARSNHFTESTLESFLNQSERNYGLEFDINFTKDDKILIFHDSDLSRITGSNDRRLFKEMYLDEIKNITINNDHFCDLDELIEIIKKSKATINAIHLKGKFQNCKYLDILLGHLKNNEELLSKIFIFDIKIKTAIYLKEKIPGLILAPSVAHEYDIKRYNSVVENTLISINEALNYKSLFDWVWLDEWDRTDEKNQTKALYTTEVFSRLREAGLKIGLVTPELHGSSPALLGGESHQDTVDEQTLLKRIEQIIALKPDALCTDYPDLCQKIIGK